GAAEDRPGPLQQRLQQGVFVAGQVQQPAAVADAVAGAVDGEPAALLPGHVGIGRRAPAQARAHPRPHLPRRERLGHVVVAAQLQAQHAVDLLAARGEEDHRQVAEGADLPAHVEAADVRQAHVQHQHVDPAGADPFDRLPPEQAVLGLHALAAQGIEQRVGDRRFVVGDEDQRRGWHRPSIVAPHGGGYAARMNYRHAFHAGNHADVLKHVVLLAYLDALLRKDSPFFVLDPHAGRGRDLLQGEAAGRTRGAAGGILALAGRKDAPPAVARYLHAVAANNPVDTLLAYPGSPLLAAQAMREQDRLAACELHPEEAAELKSLFAHDGRVAVHARDGYDAVRALLPPRVDGVRYARGLVLVDPPYEAQEAEYPRITDAVREVLQRWPQAGVAI